MIGSVLPKLSLGLAFVLLACSSALGAASVPPAPANHVQDDASVLTPEIAARLSKNLVTTADKDSIHVDLATVKSLPKGKLAEMTAAYAKEWTKGVLGGVVVFDDATGWVSVATSEETDRKFSSLELNMVLRDPLLEGRAKGLSRDKLERACQALIDGLRNLNEKTIQNTRQEWVVNGLMILVGIAALGYAASQVFGRKGKDAVRGKFDQKPDF